MSWLNRFLSPLSGITDEQAMWRVQTRDDPEAFAALVRRWESPLRRLGARMTAPAAPDIESLRAVLRQEFRHELRAELARLDVAQAERHRAFQDVFTRTLGRLEAERLIDYATLRQDVETVAVLAQDELQNTRRDLARLVSLEPVPPSP